MNAVSQALSVTGKAVANVVQTVGQPVGNVPVIGTISNGVGNLVVGVTDTFEKNSKYASKNRVQMVEELRVNLNKSNPQSGMVVGQQSSTDGSANAAENTGT